MGFCGALPLGGRGLGGVSFVRFMGSLT